jgi:hypothetical protein
VISLGQIAEILEAAARRARELDADVRGELRAWTDQSASPLGPRRHVARVRGRLARGLAGASMVGRRALLSPEALGEELAALTKKKAVAAEPETTASRIERRLGLVGGAR